MRHRYPLSFIVLFLGAVLCAGCGFGRGDGGVLCPEPCGKPDQLRDFFCNCYVPKDDDESPNRRRLGDGLVLLERTGQCNPPTAGKQVWVRNATSDKVKVVTRKEAWEANRKLWERKITSIIEPRDRNYLGCEGNSYYEYRYAIQEVTRRSRGELPSFDNPPRSADAEWTDRFQPVLVSFQVPPGQTERSCRDLCPDLATTARCTTAVVPKPAEQGLDLLHSTVTQLSRDDGLISPDELRGWFQVSPEDDGCQRGPTAFLGARFLNVGTPCLIEVPLANDLTARLVIPMVLSGQVEATDGEITVELNDPGPTAPSLRFLKSEDQFAPLDADFGGTVLSIEANASAVFLKTEKNRCIGVAF